MSASEATMFNQNMVNSYLKQSINTELMKHMKSIMSSKTITVKNVLILFALFGIETIKAKVNTALEATLANAPSAIWDFVITMKNNIYQFYISGFRFNNCSFDCLIEMDDNQILTCKITASQEFYNILCSYILINKFNNCKYVENNYKTEIDTKDAFKHSSCISDIEIEFNDHTLILPQSIDVVYSADMANHISRVEKQKKDTTESNDKYINYDDDNENRLVYHLLLKLPISKEQTKKIYTAIANYITENDKTGKIMDPVKDNNIKEHDRLIAMIYPNNAAVISAFTKILFNNDFKLYSIWKIVGVKQLLIKDILELMLLFVVLTYIKLKSVNKIPSNYIMFMMKLNTELCGGYSVAANNIINNSALSDIPFRMSIIQYFDDMTSKGIYIKNLEDPAISYFMNSKNENDIVAYAIDSDGNKLNHQDCNILFKQFISYVNTTNFSKTNAKSNIEVYNLEVKEITEIVSESVPSKTSQKTLPDGSTETITTEAIPEVSKQIMKVDIKHVNAFYKPFDSLYLKENDEFKLKSLLTSFDTKKEMYKNLGIPFKFNCLLYGPPGTGKSSAIKAIGSYLKKNLYYLDLSKIRTNDELNEVFSIVVSKNVNSAGIIVLEDIDCMSNIVLSRETNGIENKKLTLSHLLNMLDGVLTKDDSIVLMTTNHYEKLDSALIRHGRMDLKIQLTECDDYQYKTIFSHIIGRDINKEALDKLVNEKITPAAFIYSLLPYIGTEFDDNVIVDNVIVDAH